MKASDRALQRWRIAKARRYIEPGFRVLDIGCADGALFELLGGGFAQGVGIDSDIPAPRSFPTYQLVPGTFPDALPAGKPFDVITLLAVLEHVPVAQQPKFAEACWTHLKPGGYLVVTVPSPLVDPIIDLLKALRLLDGMDVGHHYGFDARQTPQVFASAGFSLVEHRRFQLGLNNLFVFKKTSARVEVTAQPAAGQR